MCDTPPLRPQRTSPYHVPMTSPIPLPANPSNCTDAGLSSRRSWGHRPTSTASNTPSAVASPAASAPSGLSRPLTPPTAMPRRPTLTVSYDPDRGFDFACPSCPPRRILDALGGSAASRRHRSSTTPPARRERASNPSDSSSSNPRIGSGPTASPSANSPSSPDTPHPARLPSRST